MTTAPKMDMPALPRPAAQSDLTRTRIHDLPVVVWLGLPLALVALRLLSPMLGLERWEMIMSDEFGLVELCTAAVLVFGIIIACMIMRRRRSLPRLASVAMALGGLSVHYFLGEEISWGQHYLGYATPESIASLNSQEEFNLHNLDLPVDLFDNIPRQIMLIATFIGGVFLPLLWRQRLERPEARQTLEYWIVPNYRLVPISLLAVFSNIPAKLIGEDASGAFAEGSYLSMVFLLDIGETKELAFAGVMTLYLLSVLLRVRSLPSQQATDASTS
ncbi:MAG: hypothetical protein IT430_08615 [Phycisphaerales bacterium]|nr:hypothetical protein [Phycisphaerales bacterium]